MWLDSEYKPRTFSWPHRHTRWLLRRPVFPCAAGRGLVRDEAWLGALSWGASDAAGPEPADGRHDRV